MKHRSWKDKNDKLTSEGFSAEDRSSGREVCQKVNQKTDDLTA